MNPIDLERAINAEGHRASEALYRRVAEVVDEQAVAGSASAWILRAGRGRVRDEEGRRVESGIEPGEAECQPD